MSEAQGSSHDTQEELESFRRQWQEEVRRGKGLNKAQDSGSQSKHAGPSHHARRASQNKSARLKPPTAGGSSAAYDDVDEGGGQGYHDLEYKEDALRLGSSSEVRKNVTAPAEPQTALEHYEKAVEREAAGTLGDSVDLYRKAFRLDHSVHEAYKKKHFPAPPKTASHPPMKPNPSNASVTVPNTAHHSLTDKPGEGAPAVPATLAELLDAFSELSIEGAEPTIENTPTPPCPLADLPSEILLRILRTTAEADIATLPRLALVCRKLGYLVTTEDSLWKPAAQSPLIGYHSMRYRYTWQISPDKRAPVPLPTLDIPPPIPDLTPTVYPTYRSQLRHRPRLRFNGAYISTNNYIRPGVPEQNRRTWNSPVHIVTYFRYLRFYRDGTCLALQTSAEPADVVHHLTKEALEEERRRERERPRGAPTASLPSVVMREAWRGRWRLSGPASGSAPRLEDEEEPWGKRPGEYPKEPVSVFDGGLVDHEEAVEEEGTVHVETESVSPKYLNKMEFALGSSGRKDGTRNNRLAWRGYWSYNRLADDWGEFGLKNDKPLYWSRVKSWGLGE